VKERKNMKAGDIVQLKSGGPKMTVSHIIENCANGVTCVFFNDAKELRLLVLNLETLKIISSK
jgi:uncharacterized protein YodC (DUF2158 family)